jgi:hypothetical protein
VAAPLSHAFHVNLGDLPTWLGVLAASVAAAFVFLQLRAQMLQLAVQQDELARQLRVIERQQADQVDLLCSFGRSIMFLISKDSGLSVPRDDQQVLLVRNQSSRPIRDLNCASEGADGSALWPIGVGIVQDRTEQGDSSVVIPKPARTAKLVRPGDLYAFVFDVDISSTDGLMYWIEFTDDAGLRWRIDQDLHLTPIGGPDPAG